MIHNDDQDLRELFGVARERDRSRPPAFAALIARRRRAGSRVVRQATFGALAAALLVVAVYSALRPRVTSRESVAPALTVVVDPRSTSWESPTDFLLATPADSLMRTLPTLRYLDNDIPSTTPPRTSPARAGRLKS